MPTNDVRTAKILFVVATFLLIVGIGLLYASGSVYSLNGPMAYTGVTCVVLGFLFLLVAIVGYVKGLQEKIDVSRQKGEVLPTGIANRPQLVWSIFTTVVMLWLASPYIVRAIYGVPTWNYNIAESSAHAQDPNYVGCYPVAYNGRRVQCRGTGHDRLLEALMYEQRTRNY